MRDGDVCSLKLIPLIGHFPFNAGNAIAMLFKVFIRFLTSIGISFNLKTSISVSDRQKRKIIINNYK